jgi:mRNA-degrading endonuclease HigB of HigAB toxin-antitoxin module
MNYSRVFVKRIISQDGSIIAEAKSVVVTVSGNESRVSQTVTVEFSSGNFCSSRSTSSASTSKID